MSYMQDAWIPSSSIKTSVKLRFGKKNIGAILEDRDDDSGEGLNRRREF